MRAVLIIALLALAACGGTAQATLGPDAGAGCDSTVYAHCTFPNGAPELSTLGPTCVEYSGARVDHSSCVIARDTLAPRNGATYASGPCPRSESDASCSLQDQPPTQSNGTLVCASFMTVWAQSSSLSRDAGIAGFPRCL